MSHRRAVVRMASTGFRHLASVVLAGFVAWAAATPTGAQALPPELTAPVNDFAGVISPAAEAELDRIIRSLQSASGDVVAVATVKTFQPWSTIEEYAVKMFENHGKGIGQKGRDNGVLVLLAVDDRRVRIEVGYDLEAFITDGYAGDTSRQMAAFFRHGDYSGGLTDGVTRLAQRIAQARNVTLEGVEPAARGEESGALDLPPILILVVGLIIFNVLRTVLHAMGIGRRGRRRRWDSHVGPFGGGFGGGGFGGGGWSSRSGGFGGGFGGFGGGRSGGGGGGASW